MPLVDSFNRRIRYLRLSVTDRCDFRCVYCMGEDIEFLPRNEILSLEELGWVAEAFVQLGVSKIRLTGGEPLVRKGVMSLVEQLGQLEGLDELVLTTNGSQLPQLAQPLREAGVKRINISLDSLKEDRFKELTRVGDLSRVLEGIDSARRAGFKAIKLNAVVLKGRNDDEVCDLVAFAIDRGVDISFIEEMPLGNITEHGREESFCSSEELRSLIGERWSLSAVTGKDVRSGPSRYFVTERSPVQIGFISPHSENFCADCNRVRVTAEGRLLMCLGNEHSVDLKSVVRAHPGDIDRLKQTIEQSMHLKPEKHHFDLASEPDIIRFMSATGG